MAASAQRPRLWCDGLRKLARRFDLSALDGAVLAYLASVLVSFCLSEDRQQAWSGADGWYMGLRTQLLLAAAYFCVSRARLVKKILLAGHFFGSGAVCLTGVLHRFRIDPLGMYEGISEKYFLEFLSTMGQATWLSSYLCTVLVIGVAYFFLAQKPWARVSSGLYCMLGFAMAVTQNSDSAYLALGALFVGLFCVACRRWEWMERFLETLILMLGSFKIVGVLQSVFAERAIELDGISVFLSQSTATWLALLAVLAVYMAVLVYRMKQEEAGHAKSEEIRAGRWLPKACGAVLAAGIGIYVLFVWLNTVGVLPVRIQQRYLLFDDAWGNYRGVIWKTSLQMFSEMDWSQKLFGAGPDCFSVFCYSDPAFYDEINFYFGDTQRLTNAHNEVLNALICLGVLGLAAFAAVLVTAVRRFLRGFCGGARDGGSDGAVRNGNNPFSDPLVLAGALAVLSYCAHNFFCYQQVCCTPFLVLILAMAENRMRGQ